MVNRLLPTDKYNLTGAEPEYFKQFISHYNNLIEAVSLTGDVDFEPITVTLHHEREQVIPVHRQVLAVIPVEGRSIYVRRLDIRTREVRLTCSLPKETIISKNWNTGIISVTGNMLKMGDDVTVGGVINRVESAANYSGYQSVVLERKTNAEKGSEVILNREKIKLLLVRK